MEVNIYRSRIRFRSEIQHRAYSKVWKLFIFSSQEEQIKCFRFENYVKTRLANENVKARKYRDRSQVGVVVCSASRVGLRRFSSIFSLAMSQNGLFKCSIFRAFHNHISALRSFIQTLVEKIIMFGVEMIFISSIALLIMEFVGISR